MKARELVGGDPGWCQADDAQSRVVGRGHQGGAVAFLLLSFFWTSQVIINVVHVSVSGVVGTYYRHRFKFTLFPCKSSILSGTRSTGSA